jgi:Inositol hexakisphosphate
MSCAINSNATAFLFFLDVVSPKSIQLADCRGTKRRVENVERARVSASNVVGLFVKLISHLSCGLRLVTVIMFAPTALFAVDLVQKNPPVRPTDAATPMSIWDIDLKLTNSLPRNFRTSDDPLKTDAGKPPAITGLSDLRASGSGEFTADSLKLLLAKARGSITIFDLRQETHIFVNGLPVSWYASRDWANVGQSREAIEGDEIARAQSLKPGSEIAIRPGEPVKKGSNYPAPQNVIVHSAGTERDIAQATSANYVRIPVTDHARPLDDEVDRFVIAVRALPENAWAHFHCEAGRGRTTTFMVLYDMLRNANRASLEDIVRRQKILGYGYDVLAASAPGDWKAPYTADRAAFVRAFYEYARANPSGRPNLWSEWIKSQ